MASSAPPWVGVSSSARCRSSSASRPRPTSWQDGPSAASSSPGRRSRPSWRSTPRSCSGCSRPRRAGFGTPTGCGAEPAVTPTDRPFPPGEYPVLVVGSGPGGLQVSYFLSRLGIHHATISADDGPGGMFRRWPFFQRLLSWTKPYAPAPRGSREFERWDWNSLLADEPELRGLQAEFMDGSSDFPSRPE